MGRQSASEVIFISLNHNITLVGKVWLIMMILLRILVLLFAGYPLYQDEQERFVCNTIQPGCANVCYDLFSPISVFRFWLVQLVTLCLPYMIFVIYVIHKVSSGFTLDHQISDRVKAGPLYKSYIKDQESFRKTVVSKTALQIDQGRTQRFTGAYMFHLMFRILLEAGFGAAHYYLFGFYIPRRFLCQQSPCTTQVDCYISRPTEKSVMLNFMLGAAALSLLLNVADFVCAVKRSVRQKSKRKMLVEKMYEEEQYYLSSAGVVGRGVDTNIPLAQVLVEDGSFRKRGASKSVSAGQGPCFHLERASHASVPHGGPLTPGQPGSNTDGNNDYSPAQEEGPDGEGSEMALCPVEPMGTPRSIRVSKRGRLKPPPPPRRDLLVPPGIGPADVSKTTAVCTRRVGQYTLVELTAADVQSNTSEGQEKRSEWV